MSTLAAYESLELQAESRLRSRQVVGIAVDAAADQQVAASAAHQPVPSLTSDQDSCGAACLNVVVACAALNHGRSSHRAVDGEAVVTGAESGNDLVQVRREKRLTAFVAEKTGFDGDQAVVLLIHAYGIGLIRADDSQRARRHADPGRIVPCHERRRRPNDGDAVGAEPAVQDNMLHGVKYDRPTVQLNASFADHKEVVLVISFKGQRVMVLIRPAVRDLDGPLGNSVNDDGIRPLLEVDNKRAGGAYVCACVSEQESPRFCGAAEGEDDRIIAIRAVDRELPSRRAAVVDDSVIERQANDAGVVLVDQHLVRRAVRLTQLDCPIWRTPCSRFR